MSPPVPYLKQRMIGSCGPACVQMVRGWLGVAGTDRSGSEMLAWARSWIFPFGMTESFGLARLLLDSGASVTVYKERPGFAMVPPGNSPTQRLFRALGLGSAPLARWRTYRATRRGAHLVVGPVTLGLLDPPASDRLPAIVMVDQGIYAPDPEWPDVVLHWVVVTGVDAERVEFHDPDLGPDQHADRALFERAMDVRTIGIDRQMVIARPAGPVDAIPLGRPSA